jgi:hypothetical protein
MYLTDGVELPALVPVMLRRRSPASSGAAMVSNGAYAESRARPQEGAETEVSNLILRKYYNDGCVTRYSSWRPRGLPAHQPREENPILVRLPQVVGRWADLPDSALSSMKRYPVPAACYFRRLMRRPDQERPRRDASSGLPVMILFLGRLMEAPEEA